MARGPRRDAPGAMHHVVARGVARSPVFLSDADRRDFLERLELACEGGAAHIYAFCLMDNHFHLAIRTGSEPLARTMRRALTGYAMAFNRRHDRVGHLFQSRYKSFIVDEERYLLALVRYIHLNPVRAGQVRSLEMLGEWPWTGHRALLLGEAPSFYRAQEVLARFGATAVAARRELLAFMGASDSDDTSFTGSGPPKDSEIVEPSPGETLGASGSRGGDGGPVTRGGGAPRPKANDEEVARMLSALAAEVSERLGIGEDALRSGSRCRELSAARSVFAFLAQRRHGISAVKIAAFLGVSQPSIVRAAFRGRALVVGSDWNDDKL